MITYYGILIFISKGYPPVKGRLYTRYAPVRHSSSRASSHVTVRLACVRPAASVHPEPGSNSSSLNFKSYDYILTTNRNCLISVLKMVYSFVCKLSFPITYVRCQFNMLMNFYYLLLSSLSLKRVQI